MNTQSGSSLISTPKGTKYHQTLDGFYIECSTRSAEAFFLVPFTLCWFGISVGGIYGSQIAKGEFDPGRSFFGLIFLIVSIILISQTLISICGEVTLELRGGILYYFVGIHPIGKKKSMDWNKIATAREAVDSWGKGSRPYHAIYLEGAERHVIGKSLSASHRYFLIRILNQYLEKDHCNSQ